MQTFGITVVNEKNRDQVNLSFLGNTISVYSLFHSKYSGVLDLHTVKVKLQLTFFLIVFYITTLWG